MRAEIFEHTGEGIQCVYDNQKWVVCIKNWKPNNDIQNIERLEVHHETDEQFVLIEGKAFLLAAQRENGVFQIDVIPMERGKVYNILQGTWFNTIARKDAKLVYIQDSKTTAENSTYCDMTQQEQAQVREQAARFLV